jgi:cobalt/nickel transport protein
MSKQLKSTSTKQRGLLKNLLLILAIIVLSVAPLFIAKDADFEGADGQAEELILEINEGYEPWFSPLFEPQSGEIESLLFALQASSGAAVIFYVLGYMKGAKKKESDQ